MTAQAYTKFGRILFAIISAPCRYIIWQFDLDDSKEKPSLLKMICVYIATTTLYKMAWPMGWPEFLTLLACICGIASRKTLEKFADRITATVSGSSSVALTGDLTALTKEILGRRDPAAGVEPT